MTISAVRSHSPNKIFGTSSARHLAKLERLFCSPPGAPKLRRQRTHPPRINLREESVWRSEEASLQADIVRLHDPAEKERLARECLGMVHEGEIAFVTGSRTGNTEPAPC